MIAIRVDPNVLESFRKEARRRRVGYRALIHEVLAEHIRNRVAYLARIAVARQSRKARTMRITNRLKVTPSHANVFRDLEKSLTRRLGLAFDETAHKRTTVLARLTIEIGVLYSATSSIWRHAADFCVLRVA